MRQLESFAKEGKAQEQPYDQEAEERDELECLNQNITVENIHWNSARHVPDEGSKGTKMEFRGFETNPKLTTSLQSKIDSFMKFNKDECEVLKTDAF